MAFGMYQPFGFTSPFFEGDMFDMGPMYAPRRFVQPRQYWMPSWRRQLSSPSMYDLFDDVDLVFDRYFQLDRQPEQQSTGAIEGAANKSTTELSTSADQQVAKKNEAAGGERGASSPRLGAVSVRKGGEDKSTVFEIQLPGLSKEDVKLDFDFRHQVLNIKAEHKNEEKDHEGRVTSYRHVSFSRILPIPMGATPEDVKADFADGVLQIAITPKLIESARPETTSLPIGSSVDSKRLESQTKTDLGGNTSQMNESTAPSQPMDTNTASVEDAE